MRGDYENQQFYERRSRSMRVRLVQNGDEREMIVLHHVVRDTSTFTLDVY